MMRAATLRCDGSNASMSAQNLADFRGLRVATTLPPRDWFGGHDCDLARVEIAALRRLGVDLHVVSGDRWRDVNQWPQILDDLKLFAPHIAVAVPNAGYGLFFGATPPGGGPRMNLFTEILGLPMIQFWDHILTQAPGYFAGNLANRPDSARTGIQAFLRQKLSHVNNRHYVPDSGHIAEAERIGVLSVGAAKRYIFPAHSHFIEKGLAYPARDKVKGRVAFAGNLYVSAGARLPTLQVPIIQAVDQAAAALKRENWELPGWDVLLHCFTKYDADTLQSNALTFDHDFFWQAALDLLSIRLATSHRLSVLRAIAVPVDFYGNFADPESTGALAGDGNISFRGNVDFITELPDVFSSYDILVDVTNSPFINGSSSKVLNAFAAGGFMLTDYRKDLHEYLGELGTTFMYRDADDLNVKIAYYQDRPAERADVIKKMQSIIAAHLTWDAFFSRALTESTPASWKQG
jgi:hypothetical protein